MKPIERLLYRIYALSLYAYPRKFRNRFGHEMRQLFRDRCREVWADSTFTRVAAFLTGVALDWIRTTTRERFLAMFSLQKLAYAAALLIALLGTPATVLRAFVISGASMEGTLRIGDHVIVNRFVGELHHGDLVIFPSPADPAQIFIKRVIGLSGDRIAIANKRVFRNEQPLAEDYVSLIASRADPRQDNMAEVTVPPGMMFLLGDNRDNSFDSRYWGFVPQASVMARPWFIYWSLDPVTHMTRWDRWLMRLEP
jgi:signal peptidase I